MAMRPDVRRAHNCDYCVFTCSMVSHALHLGK